MTRIICGVDVSRARLDVHVAPGDVRGDFANTPEGIGELAGFCRAHGVELAVLEASGGYERRAWMLLSQAGIATARVNPRQVRDFAKSMGKLEKTDRLDAETIALHAAAVSLVATPPPAPAQNRLGRLVTRLGQITHDLTVHKQRLSALDDDDDDAETRASLIEMIALLRRQAAANDGEIASLIDDDPAWARLAAALREVKGVAGRTVGRLLAQMPEIGTLSGKAIAKLAGLAPLADDSGKRSGRRRIRGGRGGVRSILWLVADIARRYDDKLGAFRQRLLDAGKPKMVVRVALARKLLVILNAKARDARIELANAT